MRLLKSQIFTTRFVQNLVKSIIAMERGIFKNKKILIMGLGLHGGGVGTAKFFCAQGADVLVTDLKTDEQLKESIERLKSFKINYSLGGHKEADFLWADLIIKNPDVPASSPYLEIARKNGIEIETDISLFFRLSQAFIIGITGTKGKSTVASLIYHILKEEFENVFLAGNIGVSVLDLLPKIKRGSKVVLELSSFELEGLEQSPNISVVTNILPDHLNRYAGMKNYIESKKIIFMHQGKDDVLILNEDDSIVRQFAKEAHSKVRYFSINKLPEDINLEGFKLSGIHNLLNLLAAVEVANVLDVSTKTIEDALESFTGVHSRQELVGEVNGVKYINDTTATMPDAVITAIRTFSEKFPNSKITLICGGQDKGLEYLELAQAIKEKVNNVVMLPGTGSDKLRNRLEGYKYISEASSMQVAVGMAKELSQAGELVLLSPGGSSFNMFKNEFDRGEQFVKAVKSVKENEKAS